MKKTLLLVVAAVLSCMTAMAQWNSNPAENMLAWTEGGFYSSDMKVATDGKVWLAVHEPFHNDKGQSGVTVALQLIDSLGNFCFDEPIRVSNYESRSWVSCGQYLFVDRDGNAIVAVYDWRQGADYCEGYTVYKVSQTGEFLWGEDGITLEGEKVYDLVASMSICQLADGSYVFAWQRSQPDNMNHMSIEMQRISPEGEMLWNPEDVCLYDQNTPYQYPYVVDGGNNQVIMLYAKGSSQELLARKLDFDGSTVWAEDTKVYNAGWGSIPIWTLIDVNPVDGGFIVSWNDDRYFTEIESAYMAYVKSNGEIGFSTHNGQILGLSGLRALNVKCKYDKASDSFYAMWNECSSSQSWYRVVAQRISKEGELLWSENGLELKPIERTTYGYGSIQSGINDEMAFFYMRNYAGTFGDVEAFVTAVNVNDTTIRRESEFTKGERVSEKSVLTTTPMINNSYWVAKWIDGGAAEDEEKVDKLLMQRINNDFTLGNPNADQAVEGVQADANTFVAVATLVEGEAMFATNLATATQATLAIYDINGALVATPFEGVLAAGRQYIEWNANVPAGIYVATLTTAQGVETVKVLVK